MHEGRFATLEQFVDHYSDGIKNSGTLDPLLPAAGMRLSIEEKLSIVSFLHSLTDQTFITNPALKAP